MNRRRLLAMLLAFGVVLFVLTRPGVRRKVPLGTGRVSQPALLVQSIGGTQVTVRYNRPSARGRALFGGIVPWDSVWCPGADEATTLETTRDLDIGGARLPKGKYSLWAIPRAGRWTIIFSKARHAYHVPYPGARRDALRVAALPGRGSYVEALEFDFPVAGPDSALLRLRWGETVVPLRIRPR